MKLKLTFSGLRSGPDEGGGGFFSPHEFDDCAGVEKMRFICRFEFNVGKKKKGRIMSLFRKYAWFVSIFNHTKKCSSNFFYFYFNDQIQVEEGGGGIFMYIHIIDSFI